MVCVRVTTCGRLGLSLSANRKAPLQFVTKQTEYQVDRHSPKTIETSGNKPQSAASLYLLLSSHILPQRQSSKSELKSQPAGEEDGKS